MNTIFSLFFAPGEVSEIRALGLRGKSSSWEGFAGGKLGVVSGYYSDPVKFAAAAKALDKANARGTYFTANPCNPVLLSRASNRLICPDKDNATPDQYIACIRWFLVDLDAKLIDGTRRPSGVSASDEELKICKLRAEEVAKYLENEHGFAKAIRAFSGNGYHLVYRLPDLSNDEKHHNLIVNAMAVLADKFGKEDIDVSVTNPARIWKFYGTTGRKGDSTGDRTHRKSYLFPGQPECLADVPVTPLDVFKKYAALASAQAPRPAPGPAASSARPPADGGAAAPSISGSFRPMKKNELGPIDMEKYLNHFGIVFSVKERPATKDMGAATLYILETCLFNSDHTGGESCILVPQQGAIKYQCFHASCKNLHTWKEARRIISGDKSLVEFCQNYDPNWKPPKQTNTGMLASLNIPMQDAISLKNGTGGTVPQPTDMDPAEFYEKSGKPFYMAHYLSEYLNPLCNTDHQFYHYKSGTWKVFSKSQIKQIIVHAMRHKIQASWIASAQEVLSGLVNKEEEEWPNNPLLLNVKNGVIDLSKINDDERELLPHDPSYGCRFQLPVSYNPTAGYSPRWQAFLSEIFDDDPNLAKQGLLQQFFGYCLLRDSRYQKALFLYGTGSNGKSTVLNVLTAMVGKENTSSLSLQDLSQKFRAQFLQHKLVNLSAEANTRDPLEASAFKAIVDGSPITTERKYGEPFQFNPYAKWIVSMNDTLTVPDKSYAFGRRVIVLNFNHRFTPDKIIDRFESHLIPKIDQIFNWALDGLSALIRNGGFKLGDSVLADTNRLMEAMNPLRMFITECCEIRDEIKEKPVRLWHAYNAWCNEGHNRALGRNKFYEQILATYTLVKKDREIEAIDPGRELLFFNIKLTTEGNEYADKGERKSDRMFDNNKFKD